MNIAKVHVMQKETDPLNLRSLPQVAPPSDGWPQIRAELVRSRRKRRLATRFGGALAAAAAVMLAVGLYLQQPSPVGGPVETPAPQTLDSVIALSQQLESRVRAYRGEIGGMPTDALIYQVELEDLIAQVDDELSMRPDSLELWSQRVNLLLDLDALYRNQMRRDYHRMASL